ncbi:MAG: hypothetical protein V2I31_08650 [Mariniphaga sp.]|jgi:hypothetical protein|nr:hypothetical protein [Mariniphaga sp.]
MKKLGKLTLKDLEQEVEICRMDEIKNSVGGDGQWVYFNGEPTYLMDEITVIGTQGTAMTCQQLYDLMQSYGDIATYEGAAATIIGTVNVAAGIFVGAESISSGMTSSELADAYEDYCISAGSSLTDTLFIVQTESYTNWGTGSGPELTVTVNYVYDTSGNLLFTF